MARFGFFYRITPQPGQVKARSGFALATVVLALVLIAALAAGALFSASQETRSAQAEVLEQQLIGSAELAALSSVASWPCGECDGMQIGDVTVRSPVTMPPLENRIYITRLDSTLFLVTGEAGISRSGAVPLRRRVSVAVRATRDSSGVVRASRVKGEAWAIAYQK